MGRALRTTDSNEATGRRRPLTPWELPLLLTPVHAYCRAKRKPGKDRPHFPAILGFVHRNRYAVASQIQRRFADVLRSDRTARRHLEEMEALGWLGVVPTRGVGPLFPKVYFVTGRGVRRLREAIAARGKSWQAVRVDRRGRHTEEGYSAEQVIHEILVTEFLLNVWQTVQVRPDLELLTVQRRSLWRHPAFRVEAGGRQSRVVPDAMFLYRQAGADMMCCFVEMDTGTMNRKQIRDKFWRYVRWSGAENGRKYLTDLYEKEGAQNARATFRVLVIGRDRSNVDDRRRLAELRAAVKELPERLRGRFWLTTVSELKRNPSDCVLSPELWSTTRPSAEVRSTETGLAMA